MFVAAGATALGLLFLMMVLSGVYTQAAPLHEQYTGDNPRIETCVVTADFPISDTHPGDGVDKTVYFNNQVEGVITATFGISGTPVLRFWGDSTFDELNTPVYTSPLSQAPFVVTYTFATDHPTQADVTYTAMNSEPEPARESIDISYVKDTRPPTVTVTASGLLDTSVTTFTVSWGAVDPDPGSGVVVSYTVDYRKDDGAWELWHSSYTLTESTFPTATWGSTYEFRVSVYDHVSNLGQGTSIVGHYVYYPLVMKDWVWWHQFDIYEPNDTLSQAYGPLTSSQVYTAYIWDATDTGDYYYFTATTAADVTVNLTNIPALAGADYDLYVYDEEDGDWEGYSLGIGTTTETVTFRAELGKRYHILVNPYAGFSSTQPYYLTVSQ
jgi:hypothetical protein